MIDLIVGSRRSFKVEALSVLVVGVLLFTLALIFRWDLGFFALIVGTYAVAVTVRGLWWHFKPSKPPMASR